MTAEPTQPPAPPVPGKTRAILHVDMDAFFASVEQRDHPEWRGKPVVVGADPRQRGVVSTCSYEARRFGIRSAMPSREAYRRCPNAVFVRPDMARYAEASGRVFAIFDRFSPLVEPVSIDEAFLDVTGGARLFGTPVEIGGKIRAAIRSEVGLTASVGAAPNKFLAKLASEAAKPDGLFAVPGDPEERLRWLGGMPVGALWGVGEKTRGILAAAGFHAVRDIRAGDPARLRRLLGRAAAERLAALAEGRDDRPVVTGREEKSLSKEHTFLTDCSDREEVRAVLKGLCEEVGGRLRGRGLYASVGRIKLRWQDFTTITRQAPFSPAVCDDFSLRELAFRLFAGERLVQPVRLIGFGVGGLSAERIEQPSLFGEEDGRPDLDKRERLCRALDRIRRMRDGRE